jgi:hypothetical protein
VRSATRRRPFDGIGIAALLTCLLAGAALPALAPIRRARLDDDRRAVRRYAETISPLAFEGGRIIQERIKPRLGELVDATVTPEEFRRQADAWRHDLEEIRKAFGKASPPPRIAEAARLFAAALGGYIDAVDEFIQASRRRGTPDEVDAALESGRVIARRADKTYDRARRTVQAELRRVGLPESTFS